MTTQDFQKQVDGYGLTTANILYRRPDHPWLLQSYVWQNYDLYPDFPELQAFLIDSGFVFDAPIELTLHSNDFVIWREVCYTCSTDPITASSFPFSRKSRSSYPYMLSKPVFGPRLDCSLR